MRNDDGVDQVSQKEERNDDIAARTRFGGRTRREDGGSGNQAGERPIRGLVRIGTQ